MRRSARVSASAVIWPSTAAGTCSTRSPTKRNCWAAKAKTADLSFRRLAGMGRIYLRTLWRFSQWVGEVDDTGLVFVRWRDETVGSVTPELDVVDAETHGKIGTVDGSGHVRDLDGAEVGWIKKP